MPYDLKDFKKLGIYHEASKSVDLELTSDGENKVAQLSVSLRKRLSTVGGDDRSSVDLSVFNAMRNEGLSPEDAAATFTASARGADARERKNSHFDDYVMRTLKKAMTSDSFEVTVTKGGKPVFEEDSSSGDGEIICEDLEHVAAQKTKWVWNGYIPLGRITVLAGDPGIGKSQAAIDLVARISRGDMMPDFSATDVRGVCIIATAEDDTAETVKPRLVAAKGVESKVKVIRKVRIGDEIKYLTLPRDLKLLWSLVERLEAKLLILDPLNAFVERKVDTYKDQDIRSILLPIEDMAEKLGCSVLIIAHLNKKEDAATLYRVGGSIGFIGAARSVLAMSVVKEPGADEGLVLYSLKSNLAQKPPAQMCEVEPCNVRTREGEQIPTSRIAWNGKTDFDPSRAGWGEGPQMRKESLDFLIQAFGGEGEALSEELREQAKEAGVSWDTLKRYKHEFGIIPKKLHGHWYWIAPQGGFKQYRYVEKSKRGKA